MIKIFDIFKKLFSTDDIWVFLSKISGFARGPILSVAVVFFLSPEMQGIWFTFFSLSMISVAAELGFTLLITQLLSHEFTQVRLMNGFIFGKKEFVDKFFSLIKYSLKIYCVIIPIALLISIIAGLIVFGEQSQEVKLIWVLFSIISCFSLMNSLFQSIYMSMDYVSSIYKIKTIFNFITALFTLLLLILSFELWAVFLSILLANLVIAYLLFRESPKFWSQLVRLRPKHKFIWSNYVLKLQGKYAVSWLSGYGSIHLLIPLVFIYYGSETAGQLGLTISLLTGVSNLSLSWVDSLIPKLNMLVATNNKSKLKSVYLISASKGIALFILGSIILLLGIYFINYYEFYADRALPLTLVLMLIISEIGIFFNALIGKYLRTHKDEPLYILSIFHMFVTLGILFLILPLGVFEYVTLSLIVLNCFLSFPLSLYIAKRFLNTYYRIKYN